MATLNNNIKNRNFLNSKFQMDILTKQPDPGQFID